jgi:hypothetical protein
MRTTRTSRWAVRRRAPRRRTEELEKQEWKEMESTKDSAKQIVNIKWHLIKLNEKRLRITKKSH